MGHPARYRIGPLTTYADPADLRRWLSAARPGDQQTYAIGPALSGQAETQAVAREAAEQGRAHLFQRREGRGWRYLIEKRAAPVRVVADEDDAPDDAALAMLRVLTGLAKAGLELPSNEALADMAGLPDRKAAQYRIDKLNRAGLITVRRIGTLPGGGAAREITIMETGAMTRSAVREARVDG